ncbi:hypothetical protein CR513_43658, partial [Mucuna pruriens]
MQDDERSLTIGKEGSHFWHPLNPELGLIRETLRWIWNLFDPLNSNSSSSAVTTIFTLLVFNFVLLVVLQGTKGISDCKMNGASW